MMAKPMKTLELHYPMIQFLIMWNIPRVTQKVVGTLSKISIFYTKITLYGRLEIRSSRSCVEVFSTLDDKFCISMRPCKL